jgi:hypothetical protein
MCFKLEGIPKNRLSHVVTYFKTLLTCASIYMNNIQLQETNKYSAK